MNYLIEKSLYLRQKILIKNFFDVLEYIFVKIVPKISLNNFLLKYFQLYSDGSIFSVFRQEKSKILQKSNDKIIEELDFLIEKQGFKKVQIQDDLLAARRKRFVELTDRINKNGWKQ